MAKDLIEMLPDVGHMRQSAQSFRDAEQANYAQYMTQMLTASAAQREENRKLQEIRKKRYGIDPTAQAKSAQAIFARPKEKDEEHFNRPLVECQIRNEDGSPNVADRELTPQEVTVEETRRRGSKNTIGQNDKSAFDLGHREAAINAFVCSPGITLAQLSPIDQKRIAKPEPYQEPPLVAIETPKAIEPKERGWFKGGATWWANLLWRLKK